MVKCRLYTFRVSGCSQIGLLVSASMELLFLADHCIVLNITISCDTMSYLHYQYFLCIADQSAMNSPQC